MNGFTRGRAQALVLRLLALWVIGSAAGDSLPARAMQPDAGAGLELDEIPVTAPKERTRRREPDERVFPSNNMFVRLDDKLGIRLNLVQEQNEVVFRRTSAARQLP